MTTVPRYLDIYHIVTLTVIVESPNALFAKADIVSIF